MIILAFVPFFVVSDVYRESCQAN